MILGCHYSLQNLFVSTICTILVVQNIVTFSYGFFKIALFLKFDGTEIIKINELFYFIIKLTM